jgi:hypothetical protein
VIHDACRPLLRRVEASERRRINKNAQRLFIEASPPIGMESFQIKISAFTAVAAVFHGKPDATVISETTVPYQFSRRH